MNKDSQELGGRAAVLAGLARALCARALLREEIEAASAELEQAEPADIADAIHALVSEGLDLELLKPAVSRLFNLLSKALSRVDFAPEDPFFRSLVLENAAFLRELDALRPSVAALLGPDEATAQVLRSAALAVSRLGAIELHYVKKENILFPHFEARYPRYRCLSLMWALHDDMRASLSKLGSLLGAPEAGAKRELAALFGRLFFDAHAIAFREEKVLFPLVSALLGPEEKLALFDEARASGFCFLDREAIETLLASAPESTGRNPLPRPAPGVIELDSGSLEPELVDLLLKSLPVDLTFVDADDRVAYFSNGQERVFPRSPSIIGRDVRNCHPAKSVDRVVAILDSFKRGERDREEFWLETGGRFVKIEYRAMRSASGSYLGTLEISQDLSGPRALSGEKRL